MKKLPPWAIVGIAVAAGALVWFIRRQRQQQKELAESQEQGQQSGEYTQQSSEGELEGYPYSTGAGGGFGGVGGAIGTAAEYGQQNREFQQTFSKEQGEFEKSFLETLRQNQKELLERLQAQPVVAQGTGGGPPAEPRPGVTPAPPPPGTPPAGPPAPAAKCPSSFPLYNPADGPVGPGSCYKYSRDRCPPPRIYKHVYQNGRVVCSPS